MSRSLILDTGSDISILQPGISKSNVSVTSLEPYGVTGDALDIRGQQTVNVVLNGREFTHSFLVCSLPTAAAGLIGTDFMNRLGTVIDFECGKMTLTNIDRVAQACGAPPTRHSALTLFSGSKAGCSLRPTEQETRHEGRQIPNITCHKAYSRARHSYALSCGAQVATLDRRHGDRRARRRKRRSKKAKSRSFHVGDIVYLYNPARKPGKCFKFHKFWTGPFQVTAKLSELNYEIVSMSHRKQVVHINRMKLAYDKEIWKPKLGPEVNSKPATRPNKRARQRVTQPVESEEDEVRIGPFPLLKARPPVDQVEPRTPPNLPPDIPDSVQTVTSGHTE